MAERRQPHEARPWWRESMVWLVIGGPLVVVVAGIVTAFIAWGVRDPEVVRGEAARAQVQSKDPLAPALGARNHAVTPAEPKP